VPNIPRQRGSSAYKAIPDPVVGDDSLYHAVTALKEVVEVLTRQRKPMSASAVTFEDLAGYGLIGSDGRALQDYGRLMKQVADLLAEPDATFATVATTGDYDDLINKPVDDSAWTAYTPTVTSGTGTLTTVSAVGRYKQIGKTVFVQVTISLTTNGTGASFLQATLPIAALGAQTCMGAGREQAVNGKGTQVILGGAGFLVVYYDGTYPGVNGGSYPCSLIYEAA
jgi:hypothetical protein